MANQAFAISGNPRLRRNQTAELNARMNYLPTLIANKNRRDDIARQEEMNTAQKAQWGRQYQLQKDANKFAEKQQRIGMGLEAGKLGLNILGSYGPTRSDPNRGSLSNIFSSFGGSTKVGGTSSPGIMSNLNLGSLVGGGLAGYGAAKAFGKKKKGVNALIGAGTGAALGALTGGSIGSSITSGLGGGLGGLFG
jgi:hypothetical protein